MTIIVPGALFAAGISIYLFYEYNRVKEAKQEDRREGLHERRQEYLDQLIAAKKKESATLTEPRSKEPPENHGIYSDEKKKM